ncbi:hypothetical protein [Allofranklinella schreckenbergeri]|uniref:hypothetical protein n=1 Tax=Allofranklinella schreckenbergeri TaxID=1076744 RepID=UPI0011C38483|nr:hypothetical protein [Allofranklinella schreckenbergeri]
MKTFPASAAFSRSRHTREGGCPVATLTGAALPFANPPLVRKGWRWMPAFAGMTRAICEMALPGSGQLLNLSTFEQNTL